jgi:hypothetical protein
VGSTPSFPDGGVADVTTSTAFSWSAFAGGIHFVEFLPTAPANPEIFVFTTATTITIPDLTAEGLALPTGAASYSWQVFAVAPFATMDSFATGNSISPLAQFGAVFVLRPPTGFPVYSYSYGPALKFTTQ